MPVISSPAFGLTSVFLSMVEARGYEVPPDNTSARASFESDFSGKIDDLIERGIVEFRRLDEHRDGVQLSFQLKTAVVPKAVPPQCLELKIVQGKAKQQSFPADRSVSNENLDKIVICFACFFRREGASGMRYGEVLSQVRSLVADGLERLGYQVKENAVSAHPHRSLWSRHDEWGCLANSDGAHFSEILTSRTLALRSNKAAR